MTFWREPAAWTHIQSAKVPPTFRRLILDWLLEGGDVAEGAEEEDHFVLLVPDGSDLHKEPHGQPCGREPSGGATSQREASLSLTGFSGTRVYLRFFLYIRISKEFIS